jgi:hypothetical protein
MLAHSSINDMPATRARTALHPRMEWAAGRAAGRRAAVSPPGEYDFDIVENDQSKEGYQDCESGSAQGYIELVRVDDHARQTPIRFKRSTAQDLF